MEVVGGGAVCAGAILTCQNNCLGFCVCGAPVVLHTLMILCPLSPLLGIMVFIDYLCVTDPGGRFFSFLTTCLALEFYRPTE